MNGRKRRIVGFFLLALVPCFIYGFSTVVDAAEKGPIRIGFIAPQTGNFAAIGMDMVRAIKQKMADVNYMVAGRKIDLIIEDEGTGPDTAVTKARKLIKHDKVHLVTGVWITASAYAVASVCEQLETPLFITGSGGDDITQRKRSKYVSRLSFTGCDIGHAAGDYAYKELGWRTVTTIALDYGWGHENVGGFQDVFERLGGKVIQKQWSPIATMDYGPYVANIEREADGIFNVITGAATIRFLQTMKQSGLLNRMGMLANGMVTDEAFLPNIGDIAVGVVGVLNYSGALDNPKNIEFQKIAKKLGRPACFGLAIPWTGAEWMLKAIENINGDVENKDKLLKALREVKMPDTLRGPLEMDAYGHPIQDYYVRRVDKLEDGYQNTVIKTYQGVSQFWNWNPEEYMSRPVYSRDYPPCKFCK